MSRLETNGYYALGVPFYVALGALEMALARRRGITAYRFADTLGNLSAGLGEVIIAGLLSNNTAFILQGGLVTGLMAILLYDAMASLERRLFRTSRIE